MKQILTLLLSIGILFSCSNKKEETRPSIAVGNDILGLASPIKLQPDTTTIHLLDYIENASKVDSISFSEGFSFDYNAENGFLKVVVEGEAAPLSRMDLTYNGTQYSIPVYGSKRKSHHFSYKAANTDMEEIALKGNFNGWNPSATPLTFNGEVWETDLVLEPGLYEYLVVIDGVEQLDDNNPDKKSNGMGGQNSTFQVGDPNAESFHISTYRLSGDSIQVVYDNALNNPEIFYNNQMIGADGMSRKDGILSIAIPETTTEQARSNIRVYGADNAKRTNDLLIPLANNAVITKASELNRTDQHAMSMYFMMVDRFVNGDLENDLPVDDPEIMPIANYYGGDLQGVVDEIESAYFDSLNLNTIWLSPISQNPMTAYGLWDKGGVKSKFSGYHGYWPISSSQIDIRFGNEKVFENLIEQAHEKNENVIVDYVANHVHEEHPVYQQHPEWATELYLPDGSLNTERWDEYRLTTWFDTFMPTLDLENPEVAEAMTDSALFWFKNYDIDGFRHDATKHIPQTFWRTLTRKLKYEVIVPEDRSIYQVGETYGNPELIGSYIGSGMLDAQFDFNMYDASVFTFANDNGNFNELNRVLTQGLEAYGSHHLMGNISGNQDRTRFISYADGSVKFDEDPKQAGWSRDIEIQGEIGYERLAMLHAFNFTVPGIPVIYYGDEFGMPGANDPDNRRMMRFGDDLSELEKEMLETVKKITKLRKTHMALIYGDTEILDLTDHQYAYSRTYFDQTALMFFNNSNVATTVTLVVPGNVNTENLHSNFDSVFTLSGGKITISLAPNSFDILTN